MASPLFSKRLLEQIVLHARLGIHLLEVLLLFGQCFYSRDQRRVHAAILSPPFVEAGCALAMLTAQVRNRHYTFGLVEIPIIWASLYFDYFIGTSFFIIEKILSTITSNISGGLPLNASFAMLGLATSISFLETFPELEEACKMGPNPINFYSATAREVLNRKELMPIA